MLERFAASAQFNPRNPRFGKAALFEGPNHAEVQAALTKHVQDKTLLSPALEQSRLLSGVRYEKLFSEETKDYFAQLETTPDGKSRLVYLDGPDLKNYRQDRDAFVSDRLREFDAEAAKVRQTKNVSDNFFDHLFQQVFQQLDEAMLDVSRSFAGITAENDFHRGEPGALARLSGLAKEGKGQTSSHGTTQATLFPDSSLPSLSGVPAAATPQKAPPQPEKQEADSRQPEEQPVGIFRRIGRWFRNLLSRLFG